MLNHRSSNAAQVSFCNVEVGEHSKRTELHPYILGLGPESQQELHRGCLGTVRNRSAIRIYMSNAPTIIYYMTLNQEHKHDILIDFLACSSPTPQSVLATIVSQQHCYFAIFDVNSDNL